jgi:hypothetical protein
MKPFSFSRRAKCWVISRFWGEEVRPKWSNESPNPS